MHVMLQDANERDGRWMPGAGAEAMLLLCGDKIGTDCYSVQLHVFHLFPMALCVRYQMAHSG